MSFKAICHLSSPILVSYAISSQMHPALVESIYTEHKHAQSISTAHKPLPLLSAFILPLLQCQFRTSSIYHQLQDQEALIHHSLGCLARPVMLHSYYCNLQYQFLDVNLIFSNILFLKGKKMEFILLFVPHNIQHKMQILEKKSMKSLIQFHIY